MVSKVIKAWASWCGPCRTYTPIFERVSQMEDFKDIEFEALDIEDEENDGIIGKYKIMGVPTTIVLDEDGGIIDKKSGLIMESTLVEWLNNLIKEKK